MPRKISRRFVMFPGLGADCRLVENQSGIRAELEIPRWIDPEHGESLPAYARRIAATIRSTGPLYLGGVSFGGMLALEVARYVEAKAVFLVASGRSSACVDGSFLMTHPAANWMASWVRSVPGLNETFQMWAGISPAIALWAPVALAAWGGPAGLKIPVFHIHGGQDGIIPRKGVRPNRVVRDAGHLLNITHATQVNDFINESMDALESGLPPSGRRRAKPSLDIRSTGKRRRIRN